MRWKNSAELTGTPSMLSSAATVTTLMTRWISPRNSSPRFLERKQVKLADAGRGKFRSFLLSSLKNFLVNEWQRAHAEKRGGGRSFLSLEEQREAETRLLTDPADPAAPARPGL